MIEIPLEAKLAIAKSELVSYQNTYWLFTFRARAARACDNEEGAQAAQMRAEKMLRQIQWTESEITKMEGQKENGCTDSEGRL